MAQCRCIEIAKCNHDIATFGSAIMTCCNACQNGSAAFMQMRGAVAYTIIGTYISDSREAVNAKIIQYGDELVTALNALKGSLVDAKSEVESMLSEYEDEDAKFHASEGSE